MRCAPFWTFITACFVITISTSSLEEAKSSSGLIYPSKVAFGMGSCPANINWLCHVAWQLWLIFQDVHISICSIESSFSSLIRQHREVHRVVGSNCLVDAILHHLSRSRLRPWCCNITSDPLFQNKDYYVLQRHNTVYQVSNYWSLNDASGHATNKRFTSRKHLPMVRQNVHLEFAQLLVTCDGVDILFIITYHYHYWLQSKSRPGYLSPHLPVYICYLAEWCR